MLNNSIVMLKQQYQLWLLALSFFTRIPVTLPETVKPAMLSEASRYFALVGCFIGGLLALVFYLTQLILPLEIALILTMACNLLLTGAFHEDGWADVWDGFGGGWSVEQKLNIMKDSRLGTYGAAALVLVLLLKYQSLLVLANSAVYIGFVLLLANTLSRTLATSLIFSMAYVSEDAKSKVKPIANQLSLTSLLVLLFTGLVVLFVAVFCQQVSLEQALLLIVFLLITRLLLIIWFNKQLGGYTGDCLGAAQIGSELVIYLSLIIFNSF